MQKIIEKELQKIETKEKGIDAKIEKLKEEKDQLFNQKKEWQQYLKEVRQLNEKQEALKQQMTKKLK